MANPGAGRPKGSPNKSTTQVREAIATFAQANVEKMSEWLNAIDDPAKKLDIYLKAIEYHIPKVQRTEITGIDGEAIKLDSTLSPSEAYLKLLGKV